VIPVKLQPEPAHFFKKVQQPGHEFLRKTSNPTTKDWNNHSYWTRILNDLYIAYSSICAYSCHWIPCDTGAKTVEHFKPKNKYPQDAYRWGNYRLVCSTLNGRKGDREDVLDPFTLLEGWFVIDFPSLLIHPSSDIAAEEAELVTKTIRRLGLNDEGTCLQARINWIRDYITAPFPFSHLERRAPFLALELKRQNLVEAIREIMRF
jgi:hypothetical protein